MRLYYILILFAIFFLSCDEDKIGLETFGVINGTIVDKNSGEPLADARVQTSPASEVVNTNINGEFTLNNVPVGSVSVEVSKDDYLTNFAALNIVEGEISNVRVELEKDNINNQLPSPPNLVSPTNAATDVDQFPKLIWNKAFDVEDDTISYNLYFFEEGATNVTQISEIADTTFQLESLELNKTYYWQVGASDEFHEQEALSEIFSFQTTFFENNSVFYTREINGNSIIISSQIDSDQEILMTDNTTSSWRPRKNIFTNEIAFLRDVGNETHVFVMDIDGTGQQQVSSLPVNGFNLTEIDFTWSSDGDKIIYPSFSKLITVNKDGAGTEIIYEEPTNLFISEVVQNPVNSNYILKLNDSSGYNAEIIEITEGGVFIRTLLSGFIGAVGGLDISIDGNRILYTHDISEFESDNYRQLDTRIFTYNLTTMETIDLSPLKPIGTIDIDPRFSPEEVEVIFTNRSNVLGSTPSIYKQVIQNFSEVQRVLIRDNAFMVDWE